MSKNPSGSSSQSSPNKSSKRFLSFGKRSTIFGEQSTSFGEATYDLLGGERSAIFWEAIYIARGWDLKCYIWKSKIFALPRGVLNELEKCLDLQLLTI